MREIEFTILENKPITDDIYKMVLECSAGEHGITAPGTVYQHQDRRTVFTAPHFYLRLDRNDGHSDLQGSRQRHRTLENL